VTVPELDFEVRVEGHEFAIFTPLDQVDEEARPIGREGCRLERATIESGEVDLQDFTGCGFENEDQRGGIERD
jgi:hypothetical protein